MLIQPIDTWQRLAIAYPGMTAEVIPHPNAEIASSRIYEVVWNCGGIAAMLATLSHSPARPATLELLATMFEEVRKVHGEIILITDQEILDRVPIINDLLTDIFGNGNFEFLTTQRVSTEVNELSGQRINRSGFVDADAVLRALLDKPNTPIVSSIPYSDPRIDEITRRFQECEGDMDSLSFRSFRLLDLNSRKTNQQLSPEISRAMGFRAVARNRDELARIFSEIADVPLVIKDDNGAAGGTTVSFITNTAQRQAVMERHSRYPLVVNDFLKPTLIENADGEQFPLQLRPYFANTGAFV